MALGATVVIVLGAAGAWFSSQGNRGRSQVEPPNTQVVPAQHAAAPGEIRREAGLDVLLITVDTLRADALGSYGRANAGTAWMDRLADGGVRFDNAHAHNVLTLPSHANILSGLYPQEHGVRDNSGFRLPKNVATLAETLRRQGYRTGAFVSAFPLDSRFGLDRGFDVYEDSFVDAGSRPAFLEQERAGPETVALAIEWLGRQDQRPAFCWVHLYEPHFPYAPPPALAERFRGDPYQGDVAAADASLLPLLEPILAAGATGDTLVVLTSDHGESLGEHGEATHGIFAYESVLAVPLVLFQPRLFGPRVVSAPARHVDLMPTILDAVSVPVPEGLRGRSLLNAAVGQSVEETSVYFEALSGQLNRGWAPLYGIIEAGWKYIDLPIAELYDLRRDPREADNLADSNPDRLSALQRSLEPLRAIDEGSEPRPESAEVRRRLAALGYLGAAADAVPKEYTEDDDPKALIGLDATLREVATLYEAGDLEAARNRARELVRRRPDMRVALLHLAQIERDRGELGAAIEAIERAWALQPEDHSALSLLASYLAQAGREAEAVEVTEPHTHLDRPDVEVLLTRGLALARLRRPREAFESFQTAAEVDPTNPKVSVYRATVFLMGGEREKARAAYREALLLNPKMASAHGALAIMAAEDGRIEESLGSWRSAIAADSRQHGKLLQVGVGLWRAGRQSEARPLLELFLASAPPAIHGEDLARVRRLLAAADDG